LFRSAITKFFLLNLAAVTMARSMLALLLLAAQSTNSAAFVQLKGDLKHASNLRVQSNSSMMQTFSHSMLHNPVTNLLQHEVEMVHANPPHVNKVIYILLTMLFGVCGCDRCFMGQPLLGCLKGFTLGGCVIWHMIDYFVAVFSALSSAKDINMMGYSATFEEDSVKTAFWVCIVMLVIQAIQQHSQMSQARLQQKQQQEMMDSMMAAQAEADTNNPANKAPAAESLDIPTSHQSLAFIPTALTRNLRQAGMVAEKPTIPELIAAFDAMDVNKDGQLDREEIKAGMKAMGATDEAVEEMIKAADTDGDGQISKKEFLVSYHAESKA